MAPKTAERLHILSLVIKRGQDIPRVRSKAKLLARSSGFDRIAVIQIASAASEAARLLLGMFSGGEVGMSIVDMFDPSLGRGLELQFKGRKPCDSKAPTGREEFPPCPLDLETLEKTEPIPGLKKVLDFIDIEGGFLGIPLTMKCLKWGLDVSWEEIQQREARIRQYLFSDIEESYLENLRAKHEEVLRLLKEISYKNYELDRVNSELLQLSRDLEAMAEERTVAEIALRIADQVRNPAMAIGGLARRIMKELPEEVPGDRKLKAIFLEAEKLERIVKNFEKLARDKSSLFVDENLKEILTETMEVWVPTLTRKGIKARLDVPEEPVTIRANRRTLKVALLHVLRNAGDASPYNGEIGIRVAKTDKGPVVRISDQGPGMPPEVKEKLFKTTVTTKPGGTGMGLIMVRQILREHQGDVEIESEEGKGSTITLRFPMRWKEA